MSIRSVSNGKTAAAAFTFKSYDDFIGRCWFIRTVTYHLIGRATGRVGQFLVLEEASWVADSARFMETLQNGMLNEVEPVGIALVNLNSVTDIFPWNHLLPKDQV